MECIPDYFDSAVVRFAERTAISAPAGKWTYTELDRRSKSMATKVLKQIGENSEPVALLMEHDAPLIAAILGVLKANKIYLVLDPSYPAQQLTATLACSGARLLLADAQNLPMANSLASQELKVLPVMENIHDDSISNHFPEIPPDVGAWLMFTSGSTSAPKGVWQNHRGIVHEAQTYAELINLEPADHVSLLTSCGLSASGATLFAALLNGATLCPFHVRLQGIERLANWLEQEKITVFHSVPTVFRHLANASGVKGCFQTVRLIRLGGEPVLPGDVDIFRRLCPDNCSFVQSLSSSETGIISTFTIDKQTVLHEKRIPVGRAVRGVEIFLLDEDNLPIKNGNEGKIAVRSERLRQGYWRQPDLTAEKFTTDQHHPNLRMFISNDLGKFCSDGLLEHLGRADQLVKIRGQRVDTGEIEAALEATELIKEAVVVMREDESGEKRLTAYIVPRAGANVSYQNLRGKLRHQLPEYMIPGDFIPLEKLPLTTAGKVDRQALPSPPPHGSKVGLNRRQRPRYVVDTRLTRIWESALHISPISRHDDFFELGGTSLQSVEVLLQIEELFGVSLPPSTLAEHSTIEKLSALLADQVIIPSSGPLVPLRTGENERPLFLIHSGQGDVASYGLLTRRLPGRTIYGLQSIGLQGESWPLMNVHAMAKRYLPEILTKDPTGPYSLIGTCMGGMVAFELAQMLAQQGKRIGLLALLDSPIPPPESQNKKRLKRIYLGMREPVHESWRIARWKIMYALGLNRDRRLLPVWRRFIANMNRLASRRYRPAFYSGELTLFITSGTIFAHGDPRLKWQSLAKNTHIINISGERTGLFVKPAVDELAEKLRDILDKNKL